MNEFNYSRPFLLTRGKVRKSPDQSPCFLVKRPRPSQQQLGLRKGAN